MPTVRAPARRAKPSKKDDPPADRKVVLIRFAAILVFLSLLAAAWAWTPLKDFLSLEKISSLIAPYRTAWYALPAVVLGFVVLGLLMVSVLLMTLACGVAFGPWLGSAYALAGALTSAIVGFYIGRWTGVDRLERVVGPKVKKISRKIERNGTLAIYVLRKIPLPFTLVNVTIGASKIRFRDFLLGTLLGTGPIVIALAGFGYQLGQILEDPKPGKIAIAVAFLAVPLTIAWLVNHFLKKRQDA